MHILQSELDGLAREWNCHCIQPNKYGTTKSRIPDVLYFMPQLRNNYSSIIYITGTTDYLKEIQMDNIDVVS